jgi:uncharacterized membrane protein
MDKDVADVLGTALGRVTREAVQGVAKNARQRSRRGLSAPAGIAAGAGLAVLTPLVARSAGKLVKGAVGNGADSLKELGGSSLKQAGGKLGEGAKDAIPGISGGGNGKSQGLPGVGKGRRMPVQQDIDIGAPLKQVYNQWTQFEEWPKFMHRLIQVSQEDETHVSFKTKVWGISKEFKAEIVEQRPDELIKWRVTEGVTHNGVVTFHELAPRLTRVEVSLDVEPGSLLEKAARGMRHVKRAVRADLARFKAYVLMEDEETGAWRGQVEDADVKKPKRQTRRSSSRNGRGSSSSSRSRGSSNGSSRAASGSSRSRPKSGSGSRSARGRGGSHS